MTKSTASSKSLVAFTRRVKRVLMGGVEAVASIAVVLLCFLTITVILFASFPAGTELGDLFASVGTPAATGGSVTLEQGGRGVWRDLVASLSSVQRSVKSKPADSIAWMDARPGLPLANRDAVQTFSRSVATISFETPNELRLGENSLVVVRNAEQEQQGSQRRATVVLVNGELRGAVDSRGNRPMDMEVLVGPAKARMISPEHGTARFRVSSAAHRPSVVSVFEGTAEVSTPEGTVSVAANTYVSVSASGALDGPKPLPPVPEPSAPRAAEVRLFRRTEAEIRFAWSQRERPDAYHLVVATDPRFESIVYDGRPQSPEFLHGNLKAGRYYWHVSAVRDGAESEFTRARRLDLVRDTEPPALRVDFPESDAEQAQIVVQGTTEPGATVYVAGKTVRVDAHGRFEAAVDLQRGVNLLVVEAVDAAGNFAYASHMVTAKLEATKRPS